MIRPGVEQGIGGLKLYMNGTVLPDSLQIWGAIRWAVRRYRGQLGVHMGLFVRASSRAISSSATPSSGIPRISASFELIIPERSVLEELS